MRRFPWFTALLAMAGVAVALTPRAGELLQYERTAVDSGAYWRLLSGQLVHWTPRMATIDLLVLLITGAWLELHSRRLVLWTVATTGLLVGLTVHVWTPELSTYRGSSGIASGLFVAVALVIFFTGRALRWLQLVALTGLLGFCAKTVWEVVTEAALFSGRLPSGISVVPVVHLAGALAGILCVIVAVRFDPHLSARRGPGGRVRGFLSSTSTPTDPA